MLGLEVLLVGGLVLLTRKAYDFLMEPPRGPRASAPAATAAEAAEASSEALAESEWARQGQQLAVAGLCFTVVGALLWAPATIVGVGCVAYNTLGPLRIGWRKWARERRLGNELVSMPAIWISLGSGLYVIGALGASVYVVALRLRIAAKGRLRGNLGRVFDGPPVEVWLLVDDTEVLVPLANVRVGDCVVVGAGELIPVDGIVERGEAAVDQRFLTGEDRPAEKGPGDEVYTSTLVLRGRLLVRVARTGEQTTAARIMAALQQTDAYEKSLDARSDLVADAATVPTWAVGIAAAVLQGPLGLMRVLSANFASSLRLFAPWSMLNFIEIAARRGVLIKDGRSLETLARVDTVVFDKTGTLTLGGLTVAGIRPLEGHDEASVLRYAATVEQRQAHPIARAILQAAAERGLPLAPATEVEYTLGNGVRARVGDEVVLAGSRRFMTRHGVTLPPEATGDVASTHSRIWVAVGCAPLGALDLAPVVRPEARALVDHLRARGLAVHVLSGDRMGPTRALADDLNITHVHAEALPEDKARIIDALQAEGRVVCFVGDGINDTIALKRAALSVAMGDATVAAVDSAQVVLRDGTLRRLAETFDISEAFVRNQRDTFAITMGSSLACVVGAVALRLSLASINLMFIASAALGVVSTMAPVWRSRRTEEAAERSARAPHFERT